MPKFSPELSALLHIVRWLLARKKKTPVEKWPSVCVAYEFVQPAYEQSGKRIEVHENHIRATITFASTITFAVLAVLTGPLLSKRDFGSPWFLVAAAAFVLLLALGILAIRFQVIRVVDPMRLYEEMLARPEWEFKKDAIYFAGVDFAKNAATASKLSLVVLIMAGFLAIELFCLVFWAAAQSAPARGII